MIIGVWMVLAGALPALGQEEGSSIAEVEEMRLIGSRAPDRSVADSPVPVDVIGEGDLADTGLTDLSSQLSVTVPSINVNDQPISDLASLVRPVNLRGLPADSTLLLVNGKRRHRSSAITFWGGGINDGAHGADLSTIPFIALKRVEVLRDGASAQYGSDAVAGILNLVLDDSAEGGRVEVRWGQYYEGDGGTHAIAANTGMSLKRNGEQMGFANFSVEYGESQSTIRSVQRADAQALIDADRDHISPFVRTPLVQIWGKPDTDHEFKFMGNLGMSLSDDSELYLVPGFAQRKVEQGLYYRNPTSRAGIFRGIPGRTVKVADLRDNPDPDTVPVVRLIDAGGVLVPDPDDLAAVAADPGFFTFNQVFPGGFTPKWGGIATDASLAGGLRGELEGVWYYDISASIGRHESEMYMWNNLNPQIVAHPDFRDDPESIPTSYQVGDNVETDYIIGLDLSRPVDIGMFSSPLNVAVGLEYRVEEFELEPGEEYAWWADTREGGLVDQGFGVRTNGYPAYSPVISGVNDRGSYAAYLDVEADVTEELLVGAAVRYERYEQVGNTLNGKLALRWKATGNMALRGSVSTGFRAPTLGQASVRNVSSLFGELEDGSVGLYDSATVPVSFLPEGAFPDARPLEPETSTSVSAGVSLNLDRLSLTLDYYRILFEDRLSLTSDFFWPETDSEGNPVPNPYNYTEGTKVRWFANNFDTITQGVDLVANYPLNHSLGSTRLTLAANYNATKVDRVGRFSDQRRVDKLEKSLPEFRFTLTATHDLGPWHLVLPRLRYYGDWIEYVAEYYYNSYGDRVVMDVEAGYDFRNGMHLVAGASNLLDTYPRRSNSATIDAMGAPYPEYSPFGFSGGFYYLKAVYNF